MDGPGTVVTDLPPEAVLNAVVHAFDICGVRRVSVDRIGWNVTGETGFTMKSWGQWVRAELRTVEGGTRIEILSNPRAQLADWGRGKEEARRIASMLVQTLEQIAERAR